ncbi:cysteine desulfurase family protein [Oleiharenicola sp. Vm1]|uniref:cysteine desulfurase family protein n=1 Tax=Oleiharenicola sp. Vm1 TaxID=3398393 RepID=UPI0039F55CB8
MIYLDNNATTRVLDSVVEAMRPYWSDQFANPASAGGEFAGVARAVSSAKARLARRLGAAEPSQVITTSGATEANNLALLGAARARPQRRHLIVSSIEHPSVLEPARYLESLGYRITWLPVSRLGVIDPTAVTAALSCDTLLVSVMLANNETGVLQPVGKIADEVKRHDSDVLVHTDATQAVGKVEFSLDGDLAAVDLLSLSAHKFHGPKGVGALFVRDAGTVAPLFFGGGQQGGLRPGTENPAGLIGIVTALEALSPERYSPVEQLRNSIEARVLAYWPGAFVLGAGAPRVPTTLAVALPGVRGSEVVDRLAAEGIAISTGSACAHGASKPSHVALAMGLSHEQAEGCIRISLGVDSTPTEEAELLRLLATVFNDLWRA